MVRTFTTLLLASVLTTTTFAQGCSDAGFCTMGAMKPDQPFNKKIELRLRSMELTFYRATTTLTPVIYSATADLNFSLNAKTSFQLKVPFQMIKGRLAKTSGMGDLSLCLTRSVYKTETFDINVSLGTKIPTNSSDKTENGAPLPMYYQTSLGTYDAIAGISLITRNWLFATGIQHPFNRNRNQFFWGDPHWVAQPERAAYIHEYAPAKNLRRGTDVMFRVERNFRFSRLNFSIGALPIMRINNDEITAADGTRVKPAKAHGMALSALATAGYSFNVRTGVRILVGHKIFNRDVNPDGLTRELINTVTYFYRF